MTDWTQDLNMRRLRRVVAAVERGKAERRSLHGVLAAMVGGDHAAAIMLEQILMWSSVVRKRMPQRDGWFWKTDEQWEIEAGLTQRQCDHSRKKALADVGVEMDKRPARGLSMTWHYRVSAVAFVAVFARALGLTVDALNAQVDQLMALDVERKQQNADPRFVDLEVHESYTSKSTDVQLRDPQIVDLEVHESATPSHPYTPSESASESTTETTTTGAEVSAPESVVGVDEKDLKIWSGAFHQLEMQVDAGSFVTWLKGARLLNVMRPASPQPPFPQAVYTIGVRNSYAQQMLAGRMYRLVERILGDCSGEKISAQFEVMIATDAGADEMPLFQVGDGDNPFVHIAQDVRGMYKQYVGELPEGSEQAIALLERDYRPEQVRAALQITQARMARGQVREPLGFTVGVLRRST